MCTRHRDKREIDEKFLETLRETFRVNAPCNLNHNRYIDPPIMIEIEFVTID